MSADVCDVVIVGQGLAGTTLAWQLLKLQQHIVVIDPHEEITSSRIAAGLITPLTGRKTLLSWRYDQFYSTAVEFYRQVEQQTGEPFFVQCPHWRIFADPNELAEFEQRCLVYPELQNYLQVPSEPLNPEWCSNAQNGVQMRQAGQLLTSRYLEVSRRRWQGEGILRQTHLQADELDVHPDCVQIPRLNLKTRNLIFCQGAADRNNPWFPQIRFLAAKGEILTLKPAVPWSAIIHAGVWLAPGPERSLLAGATYDSRHLNQTPTGEGREEIVSRLKRLLRFDYEIIDHRAAVRPALHDQKPVLGLHPRFSSLGLLNGLGSKGSLQAPWLAGHLAQHLVRGTPLDPEMDIQHKYPIPAAISP